MSLTPAWRNFKRMEDFTALGAGLLYAAAMVSALERKLGPGLAQATIVWPFMHFVAAFLVPTRWPAARRLLTKYVWLSFRAGFGQTAISVIGGAALMAGAAYAVFRQVGLAPDVISLAPTFCALAAGIGVLGAQALLARVLERAPEVRAQIDR